MKNKTVIMSLAIFLMLIAIAIYATFAITSKYYSGIYQVGIGQYPTPGFKYNATSLDVTTDKKKTSMFETTVPINVNIKGEFTQLRKNYNPYIKRMHISERLIKPNEGEPYAMIEFSPVFDYNSDEKSFYNKESVEYSFKYKLHIFLSFKINKYVFKCGNQEKVIEIENVK